MFSYSLIWLVCVILYYWIRIDVCAIELEYQIISCSLVVNLMSGAVVISVHIATVKL